MGHKVNPYGFRLGVIYPWKSNWFAGRDYSDQLHEDIWIRKHIRSRLSRAGISSIDIERKGDQIWVYIRTARPGIVIGRKGAEVDKIRKDVERVTKKRVDVKVEDMNSAASETRPETEPVRVDLVTHYASSPNERTTSVMCDVRLRILVARP